MARLRSTRVEVPPTAGLPLRAADLLPGGDADLEGALARFLGVAEAQLECSGTAAFIVALRTLQARAPERTEVVVPAYTCPLVALAVARCGLTLQLCDLRAGSLDLDPQALATLCSSRTLAIVPTHLAGRVADVATAVACARPHGAWVIEDAAQALGARVGGTTVGLQGDIGFFSLAVGKGLTIYEGGVLVARDPALQAACRAMHCLIIGGGRRWELRRSASLLAYAALYRPGPLRWAYGAPLRRALARGDWVGAAGDDVDAEIPMHPVGRWRRTVGVRALQRLPAFLAAVHAQARHRHARLERIDGVTVLGDSADALATQGTWPVLLALLPDRACRDALLCTHWGGGLGLSMPFVHALPDYPAPGWPGLPAAADAHLPNARDLAGRILAISNSPWLDAPRFEELCRAIEEATVDRSRPALSLHL